VPADLTMIEPERFVHDRRGQAPVEERQHALLGREQTGAVALTMSEGAIIFDTTEDA
jgi:hypothetical protein